MYAWKRHILIYVSLLFYLHIKSEPYYQTLMTHKLLKAPTFCRPLKTIHSIETPPSPPPALCVFCLSLCISYVSVPFQTGRSPPDCHPQQFHTDYHTIIMFCQLFREILDVNRTSSTLFSVTRTANEYIVCVCVRTN